MIKNELKAEIVRQGITMAEFINDVEISKKMLYRKLNGESEFKLNEIKRISDVLNLSDDMIISIFFNHKVS